MATVMSNLEQLRPTKKNRVMDLVREAGVDVTDWGNYKGGSKNAASNPKYCYEWSFVQPKQVVVLNLWHDNLKERHGVVFQALNFRRNARKHRRTLKRAVWEKRARRMDDAVQAAVNDHLPIRVVICAGVIRDRNDPDAVASKVERRLLDPVPWAVTNYEPKTGECILTRGAYSQVFVDQFSLRESSPSPPERRPVTGLVFVRDPEVRRRVLVRAGGRCEWCSERGFVMTDGCIYLETHHVTPLAEGGLDTDDNVVALCPNHHREAHFGRRKTGIKQELVAKLKVGPPKRGSAPGGAQLQRAFGA